MWSLKPTYKRDFGLESVDRAIVLWELLLFVQINTFSTIVFAI